MEKEIEDLFKTNLNQLKNKLSEKSKRLLKISMAKGASNRLTPLPITDFGFKLWKQRFWDAICFSNGSYALQLYR